MQRQCGSGVAHRCTRNQADEHLLHLPRVDCLAVVHNQFLKDSMCIDSKETHSVLGPQVTGDGDLHTRLEEFATEAAGDGLALSTKLVGRVAALE